MSGFAALKKSRKKNLAALTDDDPRIRKATAVLLGWQDRGEAVRPLIVALRDDNEHVRAAVAEALGNLREDKAVYALISRLIDDADVVREAATAALKTIVGTDRPFPPR